MLQAYTNCQFEYFPLPSRPPQIVSVIASDVLPIGTIDPGREYTFCYRTREMWPLR
jgi:hypothetical protein